MSALGFTFRFPIRLVTLATRSGVWLYQPEASLSVCNHNPEGINNVPILPFRTSMPEDPYTQRLIMIHTGFCIDKRKKSTLCSCDNPQAGQNLSAKPNSPW